jgi:hypothetical protein
MDKIFKVKLQPHLSSENIYCAYLLQGSVSLKPAWKIKQKIKFVACTGNRNLDLPASSVYRPRYSGPPLILYKKKSLIKAVYFSRNPTPNVKKMGTVVEHKIDTRKQKTDK